MKDFLYKKRKGILLLSIIVLIIFYQIEYKRHFIYNNDKTKFITIWQKTFRKTCYVIPGKYFWFLHPSENYIKTVNYRNYIGVIWNTKDEYEFKLSIYNKFDEIDLSNNIKVYSLTDSLLLDYNIIDTLDIQKGKRIVSKHSDSLKKEYDFNYIDLNKIYGIKVYRYD